MGSIIIRGMRCEFRGSSDNNITWFFISVFLLLYKIELNHLSYILYYTYSRIQYTI